MTMEWTFFWDRNLFAVTKDQEISTSGTICSLQWERERDGLRTARSMYSFLAGDTRKQDPCAAPVGTWKKVH